MIINAFPSGTKVSVDSALSDSSTNPVQNKVVKSALDGKQATVTGAATSITGSNLTASKALVSDANGKVAASNVSSTELGYVSGVTSAIQTQINGKATLSVTTTDPGEGTTLAAGTLLVVVEA